jgi:hypothetical protein
MLSYMYVGYNIQRDFTLTKFSDCARLSTEAGDVLMVGGNFSESNSIPFWIDRSQDPRYKHWQIFKGSA